MACMEWQDFWAGLVLRLRASSTPGQTPQTGWLLAAAGVALACLLVPALWRHVRTVVTVVHEAGHALVGVLCGRRFHGFVVKADMSGETITSGRPTGLGRVATTAAGYPMPALVGAGTIAVTMQGFAGLVLLVCGVLLIVVALHARSWYTGFTLVVLIGLVCMMWWAGDAELQSAAVCGLGIFLVLGGWRQWFNVVRFGDRRQDPGVLASLTRIPAALWNASFALVMAALTWFSGSMVMPQISDAAQALMP